MKRIHISTWFLALLLVAGLTACNEDALIDTYEVQLPILTDFTPKTGEVGTEITITGENLQRVDAVTIGGGKAEIKYRIDGNTMVVKASSSSRTGVVVISNIKGTAESTDTYTVTYLTPTIETYPVEGMVNEDIVITGNNLHALEKVLIGGVEATIISKRKEELVFKVPFIDVEEAVNLQFSYFNGSQDTSIGPDGDTFIVLKERPVVDIAPTSLTKYATASIEGLRLSMIEALYLNEIKLVIKYQSDEMIIFDMPTNYFDGNMSGTLRAIYYGVRELIIEDNFLVYADPNEPRYYTHTNILLSGRINYGGTENAFFDAETGMIYHSCGVSDVRRDIDFIGYDQSGYVQIYGPHNSSSILKNYKCEGVTIDQQDGTWNDFYGAGGIETKFRVLSRDSINHLPVIQAFEEGRIIELNDEFFEGIPMPGTSAPRVYRNSSDKGFSAKDHFATDANNLGWVRNYTTGKNGIIKILSIPSDGQNSRIPDVVFDIIWQK